MVRCVDTIKLSTHSQLANDLEINKAVRFFVIIVIVIIAIIAIVIVVIITLTNIIMKQEDDCHPTNR